MKKGIQFWKFRIPAYAVLLGISLLAVRLSVLGAEGTEGPEAALIEMEDGEYAIEVELTGGTGRTTVSSPAGLTVLDGHAYARIQWSSSHYDYMLVDGKSICLFQKKAILHLKFPLQYSTSPWRSWRIQRP